MAKTKGYTKGPNTSATSPEISDGDGDVSAGKQVKEDSGERNYALLDIVRNLHQLRMNQLTHIE